MRNRAFFCPQVHIVAKNDAFSGLSVLGVLDSCSTVEEHGNAFLCCGWGCGWGCDAGHDGVLIPFDNQRVCHSFCHHCHRKVFFLICAQVCGPCLLSESSREMTDAVFGDSFSIFEAVSGCGMR